MKDVRYLIMAFCLIIFVVAEPAGAAGFLKLTIDRTKIDADLTEFPILLHLSGSSGLNAFNASDVFTELASDANRKKISVVTDISTEPLYVEIEEWDQTNKQAWLWVKVPSVSATTDTVLYLNYDRNRADNTAYVGDTGSTVAEQVWTNGFITVNHLAENGTGIQGEYKDSTGKGHNGTNSGATRVAGKAGDGQSFDGIDDLISIPDNDDLSITNTCKFTVSIWYNPAVQNMINNDNGYVRWLAKGYGAGNWEYHLLTYNQTGQAHRLRWYNYDPAGKEGAGDYSTDDTLTPGVWKYITATSSCDSPTVGNEWLYVDGKYSGLPQTWQSYNVTYTNGSAPLNLGNRGAGGDWFAGKLDELRISNVVRSLPWIKASYASESDALIRYALAVPDTAPPLASIITVSGIASASANIVWTTSDASDTQVEYGPTIGYGSSTPLIPELVTAHFQVLCGLTASTFYHFRVKSKDIFGNLMMSKDYTFTTSPQETNLIASWKLDENRGTAISDSSGNGNAGTVYGAAWTAGKDDNALDFNGANDRVDLGNPASLQISGALSLEGWIKINDLSVNSSLFGRGHGLGSGNQGYFLTYYASTKSLYFDTYSTTTRDALYKTNAITDNNWHYLVATWDGTTSANGKKIYLDGVLMVQKTSLIAALGNPAYNFRIGLDALNFYPAKATIDEVKIYDRVLSAQEVLAHYTAGPADITSPIISAVTANNVTASSANISWTTDEVSETQVEYGVSLSYGFLTPANTILVTGHAQVLPGLKALTMYHYRVKARDYSGNIALSGDKTFTTSAQEANFIAAWKLDESSGTNAFDSSGSGNTGIVYGATRTTGKIGNALSFDSVNDYVDMGNPTSLQISGALSLEGWVKINDLSVNSSLFGRGHGLGSGNQGYFLTYYAPTKSLYFDTYSTTTRDALYKTNAITDNNWHYLVATWDGTTSANGKKIYLDGVLMVQKTSLVAALGNPAYNFRIGLDALNFYSAKATIDEVKIYNRVLSAQDIIAKYNAPLSNTTSALNLLGYAANAPSAPVSLKAIRGKGNITLVWNASLRDGGYPIAGYNIYRGLSSGSKTLLIQTGDNLSYWDSDVADGTAYYYHVCAVNSAGEGPQSNEVVVTPDVGIEPLQTDKTAVYPNPFVQGKGGSEKIFFINLDEDAVLKIYNSSGELVRELSAGVEGKTEWDVSEVGSGVYLYMISSPTGVKKGKVSVIK